MKKSKVKLEGKSYEYRVLRIMEIFDSHAKSGLSNREILRRYVYPVYPICERTFYNMVKAFSRLSDKR